MFTAEAENDEMEGRYALANYNELSVLSYKKLKKL
jgi:hypothetical protein